MATTSRLTEAQRAEAAADAERQVRRTLDRHSQRSPKTVAQRGASQPGTGRPEPSTDGSS